MVSRVGARRPGGKCDTCEKCKKRTLQTEGRWETTWNLFWLTREPQVSLLSPGSDATSVWTQNRTHQKREPGKGRLTGLQRDVAAETEHLTRREKGPPTPSVLHPIMPSFSLPLPHSLPSTLKFFCDSGVGLSRSMSFFRSSSMVDLEVGFGDARRSLVEARSLVWAISLPSL